MLRFGIHLIPLIILIIEYFSISASLKIAQAMGGYSAVKLLWGIVQVGINVSFHTVVTSLFLIHVGSFILALFYLFLVTMYGFREPVGSGNNQTLMWVIDDE